MYLQLTTDIKATKQKTYSVLQENCAKKLENSAFLPLLVNFVLFSTFPPRWMENLHCIFNFHCGGFKKHTINWISTAVDMKFGLYFQDSTWWIEKMQFIFNFHLGEFLKFTLFWISTWVDLKFTLYFKISTRWIEFSHKNINFHCGEFEKHTIHSISTAVDCPFMVQSF